MQVESLQLSGLKLLHLHRFSDARGFFLESYRQPLYEDVGISSCFSQDNLVFSHKNVVRGLHFQEGPGQAKLISVIRGHIWDVAVDCRPESPTFGQWISIELNEDHPIQFFIPEGFAHGYCSLTEDTYVQYKVSRPYDPTLERSIRWNDPALAIAWPCQSPTVSERDQSSPFFKEVFSTCTFG